MPEALVWIIVHLLTEASMLTVVLYTAVTEAQVLTVVLPLTYFLKS
jgi:hypothetical protein